MAIQTETKERIKQKLTEPKKWKVLVLNDDFTPFDFVIVMLMEIFHHSTERASSVTLQIHEEGAGVAGIYDFEIAESKCVEATKMARENGFPLQIKMESE